MLLYIKNLQRNRKNTERQFKFWVSLREKLIENFKWNL